MRESRLDISAPIRHRAVWLLQARLSDALDLQAQVRHAHWNVRGPSFFQLHLLLGHLRIHAEGFVDSLAERIVTLGGIADGRVQTTADSTSLYAYPLETQGGEQHMQAIADALAQFGKSVRADIEAAAELPESGTADILSELSRKTDHQLWLVEAHLNLDTPSAD